MRLSRDEAREIAAVALMLAVGSRLAAGVFQVLDELDRGWTFSSLFGRLVAPMTATAGLMVIALALLLVLSPPGSISMRSNQIALMLAAIVTVLGAGAILNEIVFSLGTWQQRMSRISQELAIVTVLGGAAYWILRNFDPQR